MKSHNVNTKAPLGVLGALVVKMDVPKSRIAA